MLKTKAVLDSPGEYDVWALFRANAERDWRLRAGLKIDQMLLFRQKSCQQLTADDAVDGWEHRLGVYRAYLGRVTVQSTEAIDVFADDAATDADGKTPTCYLGVAYAKVTRNRE
jgi:hypothetical protein